LNAIHNCITGAEKGEEKICNPSCVVHEAFALNVVETMECPKCKEQGEPFSYQEFEHYVPADALRTVSKMNRSGKSSFPSILKYLDKQDLRVCPNEQCKTHNPLTRRLLNHPAVITIGLIWTSASTDKDEIEGVLSCLSTSFDSRELFGGSGSPAPSRSTVYELKGAVCYYGKHYVAFLNVENSWMQFDDAAIRQVCFSHLQSHSFR
jgi:ubiquitin C-terminal hydrolase